MIRNDSPTTIYMYYIMTLQWLHNPSCGITCGSGDIKAEGGMMSSGMQN